MQNILFRADSSSKIGIGHIMRDLVLAQEFHGDKITFATQALQGNINSQIIEAGHSVEILHSNNINELIKLIQQLHIKLLIIDNYSIGYKDEKEIKEFTSVKIFVLDDTYEKHYCDTLLNHNISAKSIKYKNKVPKFCSIRCGAKYTLIRDEFHQEKNKRIKQKKSKTKKVFIAIGGSDHSNINIKILKVLQKFKNIETHLVTTSANKNIQNLQKYTSHRKNIQLHIDSKKIAKLMRKSDFCIISPSVTANEVHFMQLPLIAIKTAQNQKDIYKYLKQKRHFTLKAFNDSKLSSKIKLMLKALR